MKDERSKLARAGDILAGIRARVKGATLSEPKGATATAEAPAADFKSSVPYATERGDTFVICCVDSRFSRQTEEFLREHLKLEQPTVMAIPGSAAPLLPLVGFAHKLVKGWLDTLLGKIRPKRIICIAHEDCAAYQMTGNAILNFMFQHTTGGTVQDLQRKHLKDAKVTFETWFPGVAVDIYYAEVVAEPDGSKRVTFNNVG